LDARLHLRVVRADEELIGQDASNRQHRDLLSPLLVVDSEEELTFGFGEGLTTEDTHELDKIVEGHCGLALVILDQ
jgi:hypothetical protein